MASLDAAPRPVRLGHGEHAIASVIWRNTYTDPSVPPVKGSYLEVVAAPGERAQTIAPAGGLDLGGTGKLGVSAWSLPRT